MSGEDAPLIDAQALACVRGDRLLWRDVDVRLVPGGALHVRGANGVGKTSLLRILAGLLRPWQGSVTRATRAGLVDEALALDGNDPLGRALAFWARIDGATLTAVAEALGRVGMAALADVPVRWLSTGQRKRAILARLLVDDVPIWLLDEPANGLDTAGVALLEELIAAHRAAGGAVVLASHLALRLEGAMLLDLGEASA